MLQEYVPDLLLLDGRKCHIRAHVLATGALQVWLSSHCLVLPAVKPFDELGPDDPLIHVTNHAVWKHHHRTNASTSQCYPHERPPLLAPPSGIEHSDLLASSPGQQPALSPTNQQCSHSMHPAGSPCSGAVTLHEACKVWLECAGEARLHLRSAAGTGWQQQEDKAQSGHPLCSSDRFQVHGNSRGRGGGSGKTGTGDGSGGGRVSSLLTAGLRGCLPLLSDKHASEGSDEYQDLDEHDDAAALQRHLQLGIEAIVKVSWCSL